jgi:hypothetical protein
VFLDRTAIADGEALAGLPPAGNAGGDTPADHIKVLGWALELLPAQYRPGAENPDVPQILIQRFGGRPYGFAATCRGGRSGVFVGPPSTPPSVGPPKHSTAVLRGIRRSPQTAICLKAPGWQFSTDTPDGAVTSRNCATANTPAWKITSAEPTPPGCSLALNSFDANAAWLDTIMTGTDLVAWAKLVGLTDHPELARCEIATFRYRLPHTAARITRSGRQLRLCIDSTWRWPQAIATWRRIGTAFT